MDKAKRERLHAMGGRGTTVTDFLRLTPEDEAEIEIRLALSRLLKEKRREKGVTQAQLATRIGSGQARIAKAEHNDGSLDLTLRALLAAGAAPGDIGAVIAGVKDGGVKDGGKITGTARAAR